MRDLGAWKPTLQVEGSATDLIDQLLSAQGRLAVACGTYNKRVRYGKPDRRSRGGPGRDASGTRIDSSGGYGDGQQRVQQEASLPVHLPCSYGRMHTGFQADQIMRTITRYYQKEQQGAGRVLSEDADRKQAVCSTTLRPKISSIEGAFDAAWACLSAQRHRQDDARARASSY